MWREFRVECFYSLARRLQNSGGETLRGRSSCSATGGGGSGGGARSLVRATHSDGIGYTV